MASHITVDWDSIEAKDDQAVNKKSTKTVRANSKVIANKFIELMTEEINNSVGTITRNEADRVLENKLKLTSSTAITGGTKKGGATVGYNLEFDFTGDKTMVSLSPRNHVENAVALFNSGYPTNNVDPRHPIKGYWKGIWLVIGPRSRQGAHFIGRAIKRFEEWAAENGWSTTHSVDPIYNE